jgi:RimJ/RimL family protein N-acetyltransferase
MGSGAALPAAIDGRGDSVDDVEQVTLPHAEHYLAETQLDNGIHVAARFQTPDDSDALVGGFLLLSETSLVRRFMGPKTHLTRRDLDQLVGGVDQVNHVALFLVWHRHEFDILIGEGRFIRLPDDPTDADVAVTIADEAQGMGAARFLVRVLADLALERGVERFVADMLPYNEAAHRLVLSVGEVEEDRIADGARHLAVRVLPRA